MAIPALQPKPSHPLECETKQNCGSTIRIAFREFEEEDHWVTVRKTSPLFSNTDYSVALLNLDGKEVQVWVLNSDLRERFFSNFYEVRQILRYFFIPLCARLTQTIRWCTPNDHIIDSDIAKMVRIGQQHFSDPSLSKLPRRVHWTARTMIAGKDQAYILFTRNNAKKDQIIGFGATKRVKLACGIHSGEVYALGITRPEHYENTNLRPVIEREVQLLELCRGMDGVVQLHESLILRDRIYTILEYCDLGDLYHAIREQEFSLAVKLRIARDIALGLVNLHLGKILHQDLKPSNVLLKRSGCFRAKICDLGCGIRATDEDRHKMKRMGSPAYLSPECIESFYTQDDETWVSTQKPPKDIWALGILFFELFHPNPGTRIDFQTALKMRRTIRSLTDLDVIAQIETSGIHWQIQFLIQSMLSVDPKNRPTATEVFNTLGKVSLDEAP